MAEAVQGTHPLSYEIPQYRSVVDKGLLIWHK